ncbi:electron transfer flavoprotein subunit alpha/FixB family protein [Peptoniphilus obesi]|uniref:electron transfer flavoprotein subunit alpha/FixB family protein n=1 Tax=Peptoniphilus obesi TaxID=1472765 RepID=UPI0004BBFBCB|nr:electron transfer flavoprotein subunit alpha/FixB family protein [Peptoniphilus obesi]
MDKGIFVVASLHDDQLAPVSVEILGKARELADHFEEELVALLIGDGLDDASKEAIYYGADKVIRVQDKELASYRTLPYTRVLDKVIDEFNPFALLIPATENGRDLGGRICARKELGLVADCVDLIPCEGERDIRWIRPTFNGQLYSDIRISTKPLIGTVSERVFKPANYNKSRKGEIIDFEVKVSQDDLLTEIAGLIKKLDIEQDVSKAKVVVSGGLGLRDPKNLYLLKDLAKEIGAAVSGSKPLADQLWIPQDSFVGMSGLKIQPRVYIAIGISGSAQHIQGMRDSGTIIAINNDPDADIFKVAHYCICADLFEIVPKLTEAIRELMKN